MAESVGCHDEELMVVSCLTTEEDADSLVKSPVRAVKQDNPHHALRDDGVENPAMLTKGL